MAAATYFDQVQQLYIAYFGRPADTVGQAYWADQIDSASGSIADVIAGFSASNESAALFGSSNATQKVTAIYQNVFGRAPEAAGLAYWVAQLDSNGVSQAQAAWIIQQSAGPGDATVVNNKLLAAKAFTAQIDTRAEVTAYSGSSAATMARAYLDKVDATYVSIANAPADSASILAALTGTSTVTPTAPAVPQFSALKDVGNLITFANAGTAIAVTEAAGTYTFISNGPYAGNATVTGTVVGIDMPATVTLTISSALAVGKNFPGSGIVALSDTGALAATLLNGMDARAAGQVTAASLTSINGAVADIKTALNAPGLVLPGTLAITLSGTSATAADLLAIDARTTALVNATSINSLAAASVADALSLLITNNGTTGNKINMASNVAVVLIGTNATAADLKAIEAATTALVDASSIKTITGASLADATLLLISNNGATGNKINMASDAAITLTGISATAAELLAIETSTTGLVDATTFKTITAASVADTLALLVTHNGSSGNKISMATDAAITLTGSTASAADLKLIEASTTGLVDASSIRTISAASVADVIALLVTSNGTSGNTMTIAADVAVTLASTSASAADLKLIDASTSGLVDASSIRSITDASLEDATLLFVTNNGSAGNKITIASDAGITLVGATASAAALNTLDAMTTGLVDASSIRSVTDASLADATLLLVTNNGSSGNKIKTASDVAVTLTGSSTATAAQLNALAASTTGAVTATLVTAISGSAAEINTALNAANLALSGAVAIIFTSTAATAADLVAIDARTTNLVDATSIKSITSASVADATSLLISNNGTSGNKINMAADVAVTLIGTSAAGAELKAIEAATSGLVDATSIKTLSNVSLADATLLLITNNAGSGNKINMASDVAVTLSGSGTATAAQLNALDNSTTGLLTATVITGISGSAADIQTALNAPGLLLSGALAITFTGTSATAAELIAIDARTTSLVDATSIKTLTAASIADAITLLISNNGTSGNKINMASDVAVTLTSTTASASDLKTIDAATSALVDATRIISLSAASIADALLLLSTNNGTSGNKINMAASVAVTLTGASATAADLKTIEALTTGLVDATTVKTVTAASVADALVIFVTNKGSSGNKISMASDATVTLTGATASAADLQAIEASTTGLVDASSIRSISAASVADAIALLISNNGSTGNKIRLATDVSITLTGATATAADLKALEAITTGLVDASSIHTISAASLADATLLLVTNNGSSGDKINIAGDVALTLTGTTASAAELKAIDAITTGLVDATSIKTITNATLADATLLLVTNNGTSGNKINIAADTALTLTGTTAAASDLKALDALTSGLVDASTIKTITGASVADATLLFVTNNGATGNKINMASDAAITLTGTSANAADLNAIDAKTSGLVDASSITDISGTVADVGIFAAAAAGAISKTANYAVTLSGAISATTINLIDANNGTGTITYMAAAGNTNSNFSGVTGNLIIKSGNTTGGAGSASSDSITGGSGNDTITAGSNTSSITGGAGADMLIGGGGYTTYNFGAGDSVAAAFDTIVDLSRNDTLHTGTASGAFRMSYADEAVGRDTGDLIGDINRTIDLINRLTNKTAAVNTGYYLNVSGNGYLVQDTGALGFDANDWIIKLAGNSTSFVGIS